MRHCTIILCCLLLAPTAHATDATHGWRGNWTGLWPDAKPPLEWHRLPRGIGTKLRAQAERPRPGDELKAAAVADGLVLDWLLLGPVAVKDTVKDIDSDPLAGEANLQPAAAQKSGAHTWKPYKLELPSRFELGPADLPWMDLAKATGGFSINQFVYAHTYLHAPSDGKVRIVVEHTLGLKAWVNGEVAYRATDRQVGLGSYASLSRHELAHTLPRSPSFTVELQRGWNRLLLKLGSANRKESWTFQTLTLRIGDTPDVAYDSKNIAWMTELPNRSSGTPILVGERLFVMAEPDELLCLERTTGKILWSAANNYYEAMPPEKRQTHQAALTESIAPLYAQLKAERDFGKRIELRAKIHKGLQALDESYFAPKLDGHYESHFAIVGFTTPSPISDGKHVWTWCGNGVAACYDLDGKRRWITRLEGRDLSYASTPALVDGVLVVFAGRLFGLDAVTGKLLWEQPRINRNIAALLPARFGSVPVAVTRGGHVVRARDGKVLYREKAEGPGDSGWAPPVILGEQLFLSYYGVGNVRHYDYSGVTGDDWQPKVVANIALPEDVNRRPNGGWLDRWTAGSPLVHEGMLYMLDIYGQWYAVDLAAKKLAYRQQTELRGLFHYNALPVAASATLLGKHIYISDNQGLTLVLEPGRAYKVVAQNRLATQLERTYPLPAQEAVSYAPPITDGERLFLRGERYLYCIAVQ